MKHVGRTSTELAALFLPSLARSYGRDPGSAFALGLPNPLVLLFLIGSGHNDALMIGLLVAGLAMARKGHLYLGIGLRACAGSIKAPGLIGVAAIAWTYALGEVLDMAADSHTGQIRC